MRWELLDRYLAGECAASERREVERWLAGAPGRRQMLRQLASGELQRPPADRAKREVWGRLRRELGLDAGPNGKGVRGAE